MCKFVQDNMDAFRLHLHRNAPERAYYHLGQALHPVMDFTSPVHRGFQYWRPTFSIDEIATHRGSENMSTLTTRLERETLGLINATVSGDFSKIGCGQ